MIIGIGTDIVQVHRIGSLLKRYGQKFLDRIFTISEQEKISSFSFSEQEKYYAKRFAAKEAFSKALGTGIGSKISWTDLEISNTAQGAPILNTFGKASEILKTFSPVKIHLSLSDDSFATAFVIIEKL